MKAKCVSGRQIVAVTQDRLLRLMCLRIFLVADFAISGAAVSDPATAEFFALVLAAHSRGQNNFLLKDRFHRKYVPFQTDFSVTVILKPRSKISLCCFVPRCL
jgi:hypothetical protein